MFALLVHYRGTGIHSEALPDESAAIHTDALFPESGHAPVVAELVLPWQFARRYVGPDVRAETCGREPVAVGYNFAVAACLDECRGNGRFCAGVTVMHRHLFQSGVLSRLSVSAVALVFLSLGLMPAYAGDDGLKDGARKTGHAAGSVVHDVGHGAKQVGKEIGHGAKRAGKAIGGAAKEGGREFRRALKGAQ